MVFTILVIVKTSNEADRSISVKLLQDEADAIRGQPREALSYYCYRPEDDSTDKAIYIFETYPSQTDLQEVHLKGEKFFAIKNEWDTKGIKHEFHEYTPVLGFVTKPASANESAGYIWQVTFTTLPGKRSELLEKAKALTEHSEKNEPETLTYVWLESLTDPNVLTVYERYKTKDSLDIVHRGSDVFKAFAAANKELVQDVKRGAYVPLGGFIEH